MLKKVARIILPKWMLRQMKKVRLYSYRIKNGLKLINTSFDYTKIGEKGTDTFFGYYDITPFNSKNEIVYLEVPKGEKYANIVWNDISGKNKRIIIITHAFNTQQGCRLRWYPSSDDTIIFNDYIEGKYVCRKINIRKNEEIIIPYPIYDISCDGRFGLTLNFERLGVLRPGYGYTNRLYVPEKDLSSESISIIDMQSFKCTPIIKYEDIGRVLGEKENNYENNYINHLSFSPNGDKFLFFWLKNETNWAQANLLQYNLNSKKIEVLEKELRVSHYTWLDNDTIICTAISGSSINDMKCRYYEYQVGKERKIIGQNILLRDGHPTLYKNKYIITDTYPDIYSYQTLFFYNIENDEVVKIVYSYSVPVRDEVFRTDMHPRFNIDKSIICYDANVEGERRLFLIKNWNNAIN